MLTTNLDEVEDNQKSAATAEDRVDQLMYLVKQKVESYKAEKERS
jgi:ATP-binding cassette, subfamily B (MDR/TAP), member 1